MRLLRALAALCAVGLVAAACGSDSESADSTDVGFEGPLVIGAIPDQDPELLQRNYGLVADYLADEVGIPVEFQPVTAYDAAVTGFRVGDLDLVWFGGLTGVQARLEVDGAEAIAQRDIDEQFTSVFIVNTDSGLAPITSVEELDVLEGLSFTFGSESSTSGRLMPQSFLGEAEVALDSFDGEPGFSGSHDTTIKLVESGTFQAGVLNSQVWEARVEDGSVDTDKVLVLLETPEYYDYHWVARPEIPADVQARIVQALIDLDPTVENEAAILGFFGAESFIEASSENYAQIEQVGREVGLISE